jgi:serine protease AprX
MSIACKATFCRTLAAVVLFMLCGASGQSEVSASPSVQKLGAFLQRRAAITGRTSVIVRATHRDAVSSIMSTAQLLGGRVLRRLPLIDGVVVDLPNAALPLLAGSGVVRHLSADRLVVGTMERTGATVGAVAARQEFGYDGTGVGVAVIDSGVSPWHDDLTSIFGGQRVYRFVDYVNGWESPYDDFGHGTHVAGIIAGNGYDSGGARTGIAPGAHLVVLKVLDANGNGRLSDVIAALDFVVANRAAFNIRVINLSVATGVYEPYDEDPLTLAAKRAVDAGIVVVASAGNNGRSPLGGTQYGGITSPGNAPWVLTVGGSSHMGTIDRADDTVAAFSSRGPGALDAGAKPDLVAPAVGIESLTDPDSTLYAAYPQALLPGTVPTAYFPYMSLTGTSMSTPVVSGTVALMMQANPGLTPNLVKAILQYTAEHYDGYDRLTQGAGFLNAKGAVELAAHFAAPQLVPYPSDAGWSRTLIWGNHLTRGGKLQTNANAWTVGVRWGSSITPAGARVAWGVRCGTSGCSGDDPSTWPLWQTSCLNDACTVRQGPASAFPNLVWGALCGGADCNLPWTVAGVGAVAMANGDTVVWGTGDGDTVVWGTGDGDTVVWGTGDGDTVVWGTSCADPSCAPVVWGRR